MMGWSLMGLMMPSPLMNANEEMLHCIYARGYNERLREASGTRRNMPGNRAFQCMLALL